MTLLWEQKASGSSSSPETDQSCLRCLKYLLLSECSSDSVDLWVKESQSLQDEDRKHKLSVIKAGTSLHRAESWTQISLCSSYIITNLCSAYLSAAVSPSWWWWWWCHHHHHHHHRWWCHHHHHHHHLSLHIIHFLHHTIFLFCKIRLLSFQIFTFHSF